jgi:anti-sigma regulatory factor (Ser/Thr protein kinase)
VGRHVSGVPSVPEGNLSLHLQGGPEAAAQARHAIAGLSAELDQPERETLGLLVTELVANSVRHADAASLEVKAIVTGTSVWLQVTDEGPGFDPVEERRLADRRDDSGWGLMLVECLSHRWGVGKDQGATRVWFELRR